ncbi:MAG: cation:proton antiporter [Bdellovibrionales bacterium]|nr:cation:proton antiporter [Bdellovibrionales bacterium]
MDMQAGLLLVGAAMLALLIGKIVRAPQLASLIAAGSIIGAHGLDLVSAPALPQLGRFGAGILLFYVGLEVSYQIFRREWRTVVKASLWQILATTIVAWPVGWVITDTWQGGVFVGFLLSMSSTVVVAQVLGDQGRLNSSHGRLSLGILICQDLAIVPVTIATVLLGNGASHAADLTSPVMIGIASAIASLVFAPLILSRVASSSELMFHLMLLMFGLAGAWAADALGLSPVLGAFLAGVAIARSETAHQVRSFVHSNRGILSSAFFLSLGTSLDWGLVASHWVAIALSVPLIMLVKLLISAWAAARARRPKSIAIMVGATLAQVGEFSIVLAGEGTEIGLISSEFAQLFVVTTVLTMVLTPVLIRLVRGRILLLDEPETAASQLSDHVVVIGYGVVGKEARLTAERKKKRIAIGDANFATVQRMLRAGVFAVFGDCANPALLRKLGVDTASLVVIAVPDSDTAAEILRSVRSLRKDVPCIVRLRHMSDRALMSGMNAVALVEEQLAARAVTKEVHRRLARSAR